MIRESESFAGSNFSSASQLTQLRCKTCERSLREMRSRSVPSSPPQGVFDTPLWNDHASRRPSSTHRRLVVPTRIKHRLELEWVIHPGSLHIHEWERNRFESTDDLAHATEGYKRPKDCCLFSATKVCMELSQREHEHIDS